MAATRTDLEGRRVSVRLDPGMLIEALILKRLNTVPKRRHPDWIRTLLIQGFLAECRVVRRLNGIAPEHLIAKRRVQPSPGSGFDFGDRSAGSASALSCRPLDPQPEGGPRAAVGVGWRP